MKDISVGSQFFFLFQENFLSGKTEFDQAQVDSARSGIIYQQISKEETISSAVIQVRVLGLQRQFQGSAR